ncbi:MAG: hypothetical protein R3302_08350, partial [Sulfurimonadaceae bacterium]|nr:hypothetical protein [Sulfurimonadaceae bacterium]
MKHSLFNRVILSLLMLLIIVMSGSAYMLISNLIDKTTQNYLDQSQKTVKIVSHSLTEWIEEQKSLTLALAADRDVALLFQHPGDMQRYDLVQQRIQA